MVESSAADVADLMAALSLHVGEVARNPYHLRLPAWMIDNVRRGAELVGGQGGAARHLSPSPLSTGCAVGKTANFTISSKVARCSPARMI